MHLTLLQEAASPPAQFARAAQALAKLPAPLQRRASASALDNATPADRYQASSRRFDGVLREPDYGDLEVRRVRHNGEIKLDGNMIYVNAALVGEPVALTESEEGWTVSYGPVVLGTIAHRGDKLQAKT